MDASGASVWECIRGRRNGDGSTVRYVQLAHNRRVEGVTQAEVLVNFGRADLLDVAGLRRLVASINRYLGDGPADAAVVAGGPLSVVGSRSGWTVWLLDGLWKTLGIGKALGEVLDRQRFRSQVEAVRVGGQPDDPCMGVGHGGESGELGMAAENCFSRSAPSDARDLDSYKLAAVATAPLLLLSPCG